LNTSEVGFMPHPPVIIDAIGQGRERLAQKTLEGMTKLAERIAQYKPETIIFISPHGNSFKNGTCILNEPVLSGSFASFGFEDLVFSKKVNQKLSESIYEVIEDKGLTAVLMDRQLAHQYGVNAELDHGVMVPLHYIDKLYSDYDIVHITPGFTSLEENYQIGQLIGSLLNQANRKVYLLCSGDLSHALKDDGPYAYNPKGIAFDTEVVHSITYKDPIKLLTLNEDDCQEAAQCGLRSILIGFGFVDGHRYDAEVLSYEGPFGVGYMTGYLTKYPQTSQSMLDSIKHHQQHTYEQRCHKEDAYIRLARQSIEHYVKTHRRLDMKILYQGFPTKFIEECEKRHEGCFVSIHKHRVLRGCIGTTQGATKNLLEEIIYNAISACSSDPRFNAVHEEELLDLEIKVDILHESEPIHGIEALDVKRYGVIVEKDNRRGLLLPNLDNVNTVDEQVHIAMQKAGIKDMQGMNLYRFEVERHEI
jgi:MEMO1 family protein